MATVTGLAASALFCLIALLASARHGKRRAKGGSARPVITTADDSGLHPESLTAVLEGDSEEYLAWLADHLWPADEYFDLELEWRNEFGIPVAHEPHDRYGAHDAYEPYEDPEAFEAYEEPLCPHCRLRREDVWPCPRCGRLLHSSCGHGMRRRRPAHPYRTQAPGFEAVTAEWICTGCRSVVGLDVDHGDEADDDLRR